MPHYSSVQVIFGMASAAGFVHYLEVVDPSFRGWGDVFYFCGREYEFCTCGLSWNLLGWYKAAVIWLFVLLSAAGARHLILLVVLGGTLPGDEHVRPTVCSPRTTIVWVPCYSNHQMEA